MHNLYELIESLRPLTEYASRWEGVDENTRIVLSDDDGLGPDTGPTLGDLRKIRDILAQEAPDAR